MANMLQQLSDDMAGLVEKTADSVLRVDARRRLPATGIAWSENLVVTAHHVLERDEDISVGAPDGGRLSAELVGRDPRHDFALLRVDESLKPAEWAGAEGLRVGNLVLALGRPRQHINATLGMVTAVLSADGSRRRREKMKLRFEKRMKGGEAEWKGRKWRRRFMRDADGMGLLLGNGFIRSDITMYPGFSGGPLLDAGGSVQGMNTSGFAGGMSIAVPYAIIAESVAALLEHGKIPSGYLGVGLQTAQLPEAVAQRLEQEAGLLIVSVEADSPAAGAGLLVGDILTALDDESTEDVDELQSLLARQAIGAEIKAQYARGGELQEGRVIIGSK